MVSETRGNDHGRSTADDGVWQDTEALAQADDERRRSRSARRSASARLTAGERDRILKGARDIAFPAAMRGYERGAVDRYTQQVNRLIAELEMSASPESAVKHALDEVSEETRELLQRAHETAEEITARSRSRADDRLQQAEQEAEALREAASREAQEIGERARHEAEQLLEGAEREASELLEKARSQAREVRDTSRREAQQLSEVAAREAEEVRTTAQRETDALRTAARVDAEQQRETADSYAQELYRNAELVWRERRRLVDDIGSVGKHLVDVAQDEGSRFQRLPTTVNVASDSAEPTPERGGLAAAAESSTAPGEE